ncbi:MAG: mechanosensitive ion channel family protein [Clostridia bacterium]|nr:mechanosensitive ion channel family protein [Clostridia bacterium]
MKRIIGIVIALVLIVFLAYPGILGTFGVNLTEDIMESMPFAPKGDGTGITLNQVLVLLLMLLIVYVVSTALKGIVKLVAKKNKRTETVSELVLSIISYATVFVVIVWGLSILGVNVGAIFASLGIVGLVVGFGAQSLIEDIITGMFIIFEGQYSIGDIIVLDDFRGTVRRIGVRTTTIEDAGGNLKVVNNSDIRNFQNRSKNPSVALILVDVSYDSDLRVVEKVLNEAFPKMFEERKNLYLKAPVLYGVEDLGASGVQLKLAVDCEEEKIFAAQRALRRDVKLLFDEKGIEIPFTQIVLHNAK